jgi:phenylalanyl-tRNA synthetase beta chain
MGGRPTGVGATTTEIVLESAWFLPATVRRTSRRLGLMSDSSFRYERRVDPGALLLARDRAVALLIELAGARVASPSCIAGAPPPARPPIELDSTHVTRLLGVAIPTEVVRQRRGHHMAAAHLPR